MRTLPRTQTHPSTRPPPHAPSPTSSNIGILGFNLIFLTDQKDELNRQLSELLAIEPRPPLVGKVFKFEEAPDALRYLKSGESVGKVVLKRATKG